MHCIDGYCFSSFVTGIWFKFVATDRAVYFITVTMTSRSCLIDCINFNGVYSSNSSKILGMFGATVHYLAPLRTLCFSLV